jgi:alkylation response protein AidB-like acyl-CoA dehydrogenase
MDFNTTDEQRELRRTVAAIAHKFGHDYYAAKARRGEKATQLWNALADSGFVGAAIPEEYGGAGAGITELATVCEELAAAGSPLLMLIVSSAIGASVLTRYGTSDQRNHWLPAMARGDFRMAFAMTEPDAGSNTHRIRTTAIREHGGYRLHGTKYYISAADETEALLVVARTPSDDNTEQGGLSMFVVDATAVGLTKTVIDVGITAPEKQYTLYFDDVIVPADRLLGQEGAGLRQVFAGLNPERITSAASAIGIARYAMDKATEYVTQRWVWDRPLGAHQGLAHPLAEAQVATELAALMTQKAAWLQDNGRDAGTESNMAKLAAADAALNCLDRAITVHGGNGLAVDYGLIDYWGLARLFRTAPVSREMILNYIAQHTLDLPRSY